METIVALVEYNRLKAIEKLKKEIGDLKKEIEGITSNYETEVSDYKKLSFFERLRTPNPEKDYYSWYETTLDQRTYDCRQSIKDLQKQIDAFELSSSDDIIVNTNSWLVSWLVY